MSYAPRSPFNRVRTRGSFLPSTGRSYCWWNTPNSPSYITSEVDNYRGTTEQMTDVVTPEYKKTSRLGGIINSHMRKLTQTREGSTYGPMFTCTINGIQYYGDLRGPGWVAHVLTAPVRPPGRPLLSIDIANLRALASTRALANMNKPDYSGLVTLGELAETLRYLRNPIASGTKLARAFEKSIATIGKRDKGAHSTAPVTAALGGAFFSIQFGLKPLLSEIVGILETLRDADFSKADRKTARAKESRSLQDTWVATESFSGITYTATYVYTEETTVKCGFLYTNSADVSMSDHFGTNLRDLPKAIWQVSPLSFVADWFANIGAFIGAITPHAGTRILAGWTTTVTKRTLTRTVSNYLMAAPYTTSRNGSGTDSVEFISYEREPIVDAPSLALNDLSWLKNDIAKTSSLYALFATRLAGIRIPAEPNLARPYKPGKVMDPVRWYG